MRNPTVLARRGSSPRARAFVPLGLLAPVAFGAAVLLTDAPRAEACGCLSPPVPNPTEPDYAVNQQSEQIIFEVDPPWITAHVLINYAGDPASFAWIVPVAEAPELSLSPASAFGLLDKGTAPSVTVNVEDLCPQSRWACNYHPALHCGGDDDWPGAGLDAGSLSDAADTGTPPVEVISTQVIGDYQTVTFTAAEAQAAVTWLRDNGFIVNATTAPYMEPYVEANMVFVAAKLVPGADVSSIKPLRMRFRAPFPMVPLVLTAVAAEPHLTVTSYIYGASAYKPLSHPLTTVPVDRIAVDGDGRLNYPMALARAVDDAGGDAFVAEYRGDAYRPEFGQNSFCCGTPFDVCGIGDNTRCECPRDDFDRADCQAAGDLLDGVALLDDLATRHARLTRLTTRISPEEMRFDPTFGPDIGVAANGRLTLTASQPSLASCRGRVIDRGQLAATEALQACAAVYCGTGECEIAGGEGACACDPGSIARQFNDLDGKPSVTCVPTRLPVDLGYGGLTLPDACAGVDCGAGRCQALNGIAACACDGGAAAVVGQDGTPRCLPIEALSRTPGAQDFSEPLRNLVVCAPPPPSCAPGGWLTEVQVARPGLDCGDATPDPALLVEPEAPTCAGSAGIYGCGGCSTGDAGAPLGAIAGGLLVTAVLIRRRRPGDRFLGRKTMN